MLVLRRLAISLALLGLAMPFSGRVLAQQTQGPIAPKPGASAQQPPGGAFRVRVSIVNTPAVVMDGKGELVLDLQKSDFQVLDNGVAQDIVSFDLGGEPLSAVLVFETSSQITSLLPAIQKAGIVFTQTVVGPSGEAAVLSYDDRTGRLLPFTTDHDKIEKVITNLKPGNSGLRLYDTLAEAVAMLRARPAERRRAIVVVGEARDKGSEEKLGEVLRQAQLANVVIYSVGISPIAAALRSDPAPSGPPSATPPGTFGGPSFPGQAQTPTSQQQYGGNIDLLALAEWAVRNATAVVKDRPLEVAAVATGGMFQSVVKERTIEKAVDTIGGELNSQYMLTYHPSDSDVAGYHEIKVKVDRPGVTVRTRPGYYLEAK